MLSNLKKYDTGYFNRKETTSSFKNELKYLYDYFVKEFKIDDELIGKGFIVDIRNMSDIMIEYLFNNYEEFQRTILAYDFFKNCNSEKNNSFSYSYNMQLIFLYDQNRKYNIDKYNVLYNIDYALKHFMTLEELNILLNKDYPSKNLNKETLIYLKDEVIKLKAFNYICGNNCSGKTKLLHNISKTIKVPVFSMNDIHLNLENYISNKFEIKKYLYQLTGSYEIGKYSDYEKYVHRLAQILEFSKEHNNMLLLDDLRWNSLDTRSTINLIDTLFDYSLNNEGIVITGCDQGTNIKRKVYNANIIKL